jgi:alkylation response protein AidB-like acyl-CoA dehydrogenase
MRIAAPRHVEAGRDPPLRCAAMRGFELAPELEELRDAAERLGRTALTPNVRANEAAGRWPEAVLDVLDGFPLGGLDLPAELGGVGAGLLAKVVVLEALATADAGGLAAADRPGLAAGAVAACPDRGVAGEVAAACLAGSAHCALTVVDPERRTPVLEWAPGWPTLRWVWAMEGDTLLLLEVAGTPTPVAVLAFQASGGVGLPLADTAERGRWALAPWTALTVRARARLWAAAIAVGVAGAALADTIEYTTERVVFGKPVAHHQGNAFDLAHAAARLHGARLAVRDAAAALDGEEPDAAFWATQAWLEVVEAAHLATNLGIQLLGGHGFIVDHLAEKRFREARMLAMLAGARDSAELDVAAHALDVPDPLTGRPA